MRHPVALALCAALLPAPAVAQQSASTPARSAANAAPPRTMQAVRRTGPIAIDGKLDDAAWASAAPSGGFTQAYPQPGKPAPDATEVRVLYDDQALYVGIRMFDAHPDSIAAGLARRDATAATGIYTDWVHLIIDSYHDRRTAFRFSTSPRGVQKDVFTSNDGNEDL
ncbi:MAG TPA: carbohydrate binding family 9 domain-containing protein, partial [Gemmatimonadales bacterium]